MKILITSGGTREHIDQVRSITNHSTGQLGKQIAQIFLQNGHSVSLVTTKTAVKPIQQENLTIYEISNVASLQETLKPLVKEHDVLIHSMAVSDYTPVYMTSLEEVEQTDSVQTLLHKKNTQGKISSKDSFQVLFLKKTPKIISLIKEWNPSIILIGFKLLVAVSKEELVSTARDSLKNNRADCIVANDLTDITSTQHIAYFVTSEGEEIVTTKQAIAEKLLALVTQKGDQHG